MIRTQLSELIPPSLTGREKTPLSETLRILKEAFGVNAVSIYLKLRVLGAVETVEGNTIKSRIQSVAERSFHDEEGLPRVLTSRTIQTWYSLMNKGGVEMLENRPSKDRGSHRKISPEALGEAIEQVLPEFRDER